MKKTLSFVLVLALVLSSFSMAFAGTTATTTKTAVPSDVAGTAFEAPVTVLTALGVVNGYEDGSYKPSANVTRAEFAKLIIAELGLEKNAQSSKSTFTDMGGSAWADGYVGYAASLGIINGYGDGRFGPSDNVTYDQALTMIVRALGYTSACKEMNGTWPAIYVQKARVLGITDDITNGGAVAANRGDVAIMLYNTLTCDMGYANDEGTFVTKKDKDGDTIKVATSLDAEESDKYEVITKSDADNSVVNIRQYVGAYAKVFTLTKGDNDGDIIAISDVKSDFVTGEYKAADKVIETADGTEYKLDDIASKGVVGTSKELDSKYTAYEFVNGDTGSKGSTILDAGQDSLDTDKGGMIVTIAADLSGKTIKGIYSVSKWHINSDEQVEADDVASIKNNKTLLGKDFTLDDGDDSIDTTSFELIGAKSLDDIKVDDVVYVYTAGSDDEITRVAVGSQTATGEVTAVKEDTSNAKATINGTVYKFASQKLKLNGTTADFNDSDIDTEDDIKAFLDAYGYMYDYELASGGAQNYAVVLENGKGSNSIGSKHEIKLFLADGTDKVFNTDDDLFKASGVVPGVTTLASIGNGWEAQVGQIVKYGLDKDGVIDSFEKMSADKDYQLVTSHAKGDNTQSDITKKGYYANEEIRQDAVIFSFESTAGAITTDEDDYNVTTLEKVLDTEKVNATYVVYKNKIAAMLMYDYAGSDEVYGVVTEAKKDTSVAGSDYSAKMLVDGKAVTYGLSSETIYGIARQHTDATTTAGIDSVFKLKFNATGEISGLTAAWTDPAPTGDTYSTESAIVGTNEKATYQNNTFKLNNQSIKCQNDIKVYKNDDGDFKVGSTSDLSSLNSGAHVYFFDTEDDNNNGLMNIAYVYNPGKAVATSSGAVTTAGKVTMDTTNKVIVVDGKAYIYGATTILKNVNGTVIAVGVTQIEAALAANDEVKDVVADSNKVITSFVGTKVATEISAATTVINLIKGFTTPNATLAEVTAATNAYNALTASRKDLVTNYATLKAAADKFANAEAKIVADAKAALAITYTVGGDSATNVTGDLTLPQTATGTTVAWVSDDASTIDVTTTPGTGDVHPASYTIGDKVVKLTATITSTTDTTVKDTRVFTVTVKALAATATETRLKAVNDATTAAEMRTALEALITATELTAGSYTGLVSAQKDMVAQSVLNARPAAGFTNAAAVQTAFNAAL